MTKEERTAVFIDSLETPLSPLLEEIEREALANRIPVIAKETQRLLIVLLLIQKPGSILEVGTAVGFSALLMSEYAPKGCRITTIEKDQAKIDKARENLKRAGKENEITLLAGDALETLRCLRQSYDFIFLDGAKAQYIRYLAEMLRLLSPGGVLVSDNVLLRGEIIEPRLAVQRRDRTIHSRMREYLYQIRHNQELATAIIPSADGIAISVRKTF